MITIILFVINSLIIGSYNILCLIYGDKENIYTTTSNKVFWLMLLIAFVLIIIGAINRNKEWDKFFNISRISLSLLMMVSLYFLLIDVEPLENDYTRSDLELKQSIDFESYAVLKPLFKEAGVNKNIAEAGFEELYSSENYIQYSDKILKSWKDLSNIRKTIKKLDEFDAFCHLHPDVKLDFDTPTLDFSLLRAVSKAYGAYVILMVKQGQSNEGVNQLCLLHRVAKKGLASAETLANKMAWSLIIEKNIRTAYEIIISKKTNSDICKRLKTDFMPLSSEEISLQHVFIAEYLVNKKYCQNYISASSYIDSFGVTDENRRTGLPKMVLSSLIYFLSFKKNSTIKDIRNYWDFYINGVQNDPPDVTAAETYLLKYMKSPKLQNMAGWVYVIITQPNFEPYVSRISERKILSDMLALSIYKCLNLKLEIKDFYNSKPYILSENGMVLSYVGQDGISGSEDDIKLGKE